MKDKTELLFVNEEVYGDVPNTEEIKPLYKRGEELLDKIVDKKLEFTAGIKCPTCNSEHYYKFEVLLEDNFIKPISYPIFNKEVRDDED